MNVENDLSELALGCFYVLAGAAMPVFPGTSHSGPSTVVRIERTTRPIFEGHWSRFPIEVDWRFWDDVVVPVLEDPRWIFDLPLNAHRVNTGGISGFIYELEIDLYQAMQASGYIT